MTTLGEGGFTTNYSVDQRQGRRWPRPMPLVARNILWVGALHPGPIGPRCPTMLPGSNIRSRGAATAPRVALHVLRGWRVARVHRRANPTPNALHATKCTQYTKIHRPLSVADFNLRRESRGPSARARALSSKKKCPQFLPVGKPRTKYCKFVAQMCPMDTSG